MGNTFAYLMLIIFPFISIYWYKTRSIQKATLWTLLGGFMFLPVKTSIDFPLIPPLNKYAISVISALIGCKFIKAKSIRFLSNKGFMKILVWLLPIYPFITSQLNTEPIFTGSRVIQGLTFHDALSDVIKIFLFIAPFFIGRRFFRTYEDQLLLFKTMVVAGLIYSIPILLEVRMSPQLHTWVYGFFPHSFIQQKRFDGFRAVVFIGHGLEVAFFTSINFIALIALWKNRINVGVYKSKFISVYFLFILLLCKSVASFLYGFFSLCLLNIFSNKRVSLFAYLLAFMALSYPALSLMNMFPHEKIIELATSYNEDRGQSLGFRFKNEEMLLEHARNKLFFGWGTWGRNRVYDENGYDLSTTDGTWVIQFGMYGCLGFIVMFGLMYLVVFRAYKIMIKIPDKQDAQKTMLAAHMLIVAIIMVDQLPNSSLVPWYWFVIGVLLGRCEYIEKYAK